jgi:hypothetical protein
MAGPKSEMAYSERIPRVERSGVSRPARRAARCARWTDASARSFLAPGRYAFAPLTGGLRRSAKTFTDTLVHRQLRLPPSRRRRPGRKARWRTQSGIHGASPFVGRSRKLGEECVAVQAASTIFVFFLRNRENIGRDKPFYSVGTGCSSCFSCKRKVQLC